MILTLILTCHLVVYLRLIQNPLKQQEDCFHHLPLHFACVGQASKEVIDLWLEKYHWRYPKKGYGSCVGSTATALGLCLSSSQGGCQIIAWRLSLSSPRGGMLWIYLTCPKQRLHRNPEFVQSILMQPGIMMIRDYYHCIMHALRALKTSSSCYLQHIPGHSSTKGFHWNGCRCTSSLMPSQKNGMFSSVGNWNRRCPRWWLMGYCSKITLKVSNPKKDKDGWTPLSSQWNEWSRKSTPHTCTTRSFKWRATSRKVVGYITLYYEGYELTLLAKNLPVFEFCIYTYYLWGRYKFYVNRRMWNITKRYQRRRRTRTPGKRKRHHRSEDKQNVLRLASTVAYIFSAMKRIHTSRCCGIIPIHPISSILWFIVHHSFS